MIIEDRLLIEALTCGALSTLTSYIAWRFGFSTGYHSRMREDQLEWAKVTLAATEQANAKQNLPPSTLDLAKLIAPQSLGMDVPVPQLPQFQQASSNETPQPPPQTLPAWGVRIVERTDDEDGPDMKASEA